MLEIAKWQWQGEDTIYLAVEDEVTLGEGKTPIEAACNGADQLAKPGSYYWHMAVCQFLMNSDAITINFGYNPFHEYNREKER